MHNLSLLTKVSKRLGCFAITTPAQRVMITTLSELPQAAKQAVSPALIVVGRVVKLHDTLKWFFQRDN